MTFEEWFEIEKAKYTDINQSENRMTIQLGIEILLKENL